MISIIIPTYNSAEILEKNILRITEFFGDNKMEFELVIIVDGSSDESIRILHNLTLKISQLRIVSYIPNRGKGYAILKGFQVSRGQIIAIYDIDMSASLNSLLELINIQKNEKYDMVLGSRYLTKKRVNQSRTRRIFGKSYNLIIRFIFLLSIYDTQCGCKVFSERMKNNALSNSYITGFAFDAPMIKEGIKQKYTFLEVPIEWNQEETSFIMDLITVIFMGPKMLLDIVRFKIGILQKISLGEENEN